MALQFLVDKLDTIPEPQRGLYAKTEDGKFRLDLDGYEDPAGLKSALDKERRAARDASRDVAAWKALGKTPEEIQALVDAQAESERSQLTKAGEWDKLRGQMTEQHQTELAKRDETAKTLRGQLEKHLVDAAATSALAAADGNPELLLPHVKSRVKVIEENGEFVVRVIDANGNPRVDVKGAFLSIADLVGEMRQTPTFAPCFPKAQGSNAPGSSNGSSRATGQDIFKLPARERLTAARAQQRK
jgi:hypothetical protein